MEWSTVTSRARSVSFAGSSGLREIGVVAQRHDARLLILRRDEEERARLAAVLGELGDRPGAPGGPADVLGQRLDREVAREGVEQPRERRSP